ncbi:hypothetical protein EH221_03655 [bacterium]|nr:MAG: hypothetical protein EH221_03655 [bacterium]
MNPPIRMTYHLKLKPTPTTIACSSRKKSLIRSKTIDYLCIGHLTEDITPEGIQLGGSATYSTLTAKAFHMHCGLVTSYLSTELPPLFSNIETSIQTTNSMLQFENRYENNQRFQFVRQETPPLQLTTLPKEFYQAQITHFGPVLNDFDPADISSFKDTFIGITPQGWLRENVNGKVHKTSWEKIAPILTSADAVILSQEDIEYNQQTIVSMRNLCRLLIVTEGYHGAKIYQDGNEYHLHAPEKKEVDPTGAGDIFSTAFFILYQRGFPLLLAGKIATEIASLSVTRKGLEGIPTAEEIIKIIHLQKHNESRKDG